MTPIEYVETVVLDTVYEFIDAPDNKRLAYLSCIATYHICDYVGYTNGIGINKVKSDLNELCANAWSVVVGLSNGTKHPKNIHAYGPQNLNHARIFSFDTKGAGWDDGFWDGPALYCGDRTNTLFVHHCVKIVIMCFCHIYAEIFSGIDLSRFHDFVKKWQKISLPKDNI